MKKMKPMLRETKEIVQGTNSDAKETGTQINGVNQKEERNIQPENNEETRIQKNEETLRNLQDILKCSNIQIIGVPEGEEEEQKLENLFEQIMKENFPNLAKEIDFQEVQEAQRVPKKLDPRRNSPSPRTLISLGGALSPPPVLVLFVGWRLQAVIFL